MALSPSEFAKWRCLVALIHADGHVDRAEQNVLDLQFKRLTLSSDQAKQLNEDQRDPQDLKELHKQITEKSDREDLVHLAYTLFWSDSDFDESERQAYQYLKDNV